MQRVNIDSLHSFHIKFLKSESNMKIKDQFQIVEVAGEYLAIPVGKEIKKFQGIAILSEDSFFLLKKMEENRTKIELIEMLQKEYDIDEANAEREIDIFLEKLHNLGIVEE